MKLITPKEGTLKGKVQLSTSKSESNRALMIRAYGGFDRLITQLSEADDTRLLKSNLKMIKACSQSAIPLIVDCSNAGTVFRFLLTYLATLPGKWLLTGSDRLLQRPIGGLVEALEILGADIRYTGKTGYGPLLINGKELNGGTTSIDISKSSQFASSLLLAAPLWKNGIDLKLTGDQRSLPYVEMTTELMKHFGASVTWEHDRIVVDPKVYQNVSCRIQPDWSSASYWYEMMALSEGGELMLDKLSLSAHQGDKIVAKLFESFGVQSYQEPDGVRVFKSGTLADTFECDCRHFPDLLPAIAVTAAGLGVAARFSGLENLVHKESNRLLALKTELAKIDVGFEAVGEGVYELKPNPTLPYFDQSKPLLINCWADHRIAMAFAPLALKVGAMQFNTPEVVSKSYPSYWSVIKKLGIMNQS